MLQITPDSEHYSLWRRIRKELALLAYLQIILLIFYGINITLNTSLLLMYILMLSMKRNRIIYNLTFDDENQTITINYFHLILWKQERTIPYSSLNSRVSMKRFGLGSYIKTLELLRRKELIGEIRLAGKWRWNEESFERVTDKLRQTGAH